MKIDNIDFISSDGVLASNFSFRDVNSENPYSVNDIIGLDADSIMPKFYGFSEYNSVKYYSLVLEKRQVVINVTLNPQTTDGETYASLRDNLYRNISSSRTGIIKLLFKYGNTVVSQLIGFVTKFESILFSKNPEVKITIDCDDPILKAITPVLVDTSDFGFLPTVVDEISTAPHGFEFSITFTENATSFQLYDQLIYSWRFICYFDFLVGDELRFSSRTEDKSLYIIRGGLTISLIDRVLLNSVWPILFPGTNVFYISTLSVYEWNYLKHYYNYWGV